MLLAHTWAAEGDTNRESKLSNYPTFDRYIIGKDSDAKDVRRRVERRRSLRKLGGARRGGDRLGLRDAGYPPSRAIRSALGSGECALSDLWEALRNTFSHYHHRP